MKNVYLAITTYGNYEHEMSFVQGIYRSMDGAVIASCDFAQSQGKTYIPDSVDSFPDDENCIYLLWSGDIYVTTTIEKEKLRD